MRLYDISIKVRGGLLEYDTLHILVEANNWTDFETEMNLDMWWEDDDLVDEGRRMGRKTSTARHSIGLASFSKKVRRGEWLPIKDGGKVQITAHRVTMAFVEQMSKMDLLYKKRGPGCAFPF